MYIVHSPARRLPLALPVHSMAGVSPRLGAFDPFSAIAEIGGTILGGIFGGDKQTAQLKTQRKMAQDQLNSANFIAQLQSDMGMKQVDATVETERIRAANELAAINAAYSANLSSQRVKKQVAEDALSAQLLAQTQSGVFGLAQTGFSQSASIARTYPVMTSGTIVLLVLVTAGAISYMKRGAPKRGRRKKRRPGGSWSRASSPPPYSPVSSPIGVVS